MSATPDFYTRATEQLRTMDGDDTVVLATLNAGNMMLQTRTPRGPAELLHIARRLLEEVRAQYAEAEAAAADDASAEKAGDRLCILDDALGILPDPDEIAEGER